MVYHNRQLQRKAFKRRLRVQLTENIENIVYGFITGIIFGIILLSII